ALVLLGPALAGDSGVNGSADAAAVTFRNRTAAGLPISAIPTLPTGVTITPTGADPELSIPVELHAAAGGTVTVPVMLDDPHPAGSTGMTEAVLTLTFDPAVLTVSAADVALGSIPLSGSGWQLTTAIDLSTGQ